MPTSSPKKKIVAVSGGFDPLHQGHIAYLKEAKKLGDELVVILNSDAWLRRKKGYALIDEQTRATVLAAIKYVDKVFIYKSERDDVTGALLFLKPDIFAKGGDRVKGNVPEEMACLTNGIEVVYEVGGGKENSSSELFQNAFDELLRTRAIASQSVPSEKFEQFWSLYPRKTNKKGAVRAWNRLGAKQVEEVLSDIVKRVRSRSWTEQDGRFIPHASTYLNGERWNDPIEEMVQQKKVELITKRK